MANNQVKSNITFHKDVSVVSDGSIYHVDSDADTLNIDFKIDTDTTFVANFEGRISSDGDWNSVAAFNLNTVDVSTKATTADVFQIDLTAWNDIRVRISSITGLVSVYGKAVG